MGEGEAQPAGKAGVCPNLLDQPRLGDTTCPTRPPRTAQQLGTLEKNHRPEYGCWLCPRLPAGHLPGPPSSQVEPGFPMWADCGDLTPGTQRPCSPGLHHTWLCSGCRALSSLCVFAPAPHLSVPGAPARGTPAQSPRAVPPQPGRPTRAPTWRRPSPPGHTRTHCGSWSGSR